MRTISLLILIASLSSANVYLPRAKLVGETVNVLVTQENAIVEGIFAFNDWGTRDEKMLYLPIYAPGGETAGRLLAVAQVEVEMDGKPVEGIEPCSPPSGFERPRNSRPVQWFRWPIGLGESEVVEVGTGPRVRVRYCQPLIGARFYYLPVIAGSSKSPERQWAYQMHVRGVGRVPRPCSKEIDCEVLGSVLTVYLKNGDEIQIQ
jgi:hypothetical protein